jgi:acetyl-CoA hydrolase
LIEFLQHEVDHGRLPVNLLPIQSGIGNIANAVIGGLSGGQANFKNLKVWTEVLQDTFLDLFDSGRLDFATSTSIRFSPEGFKRFYDGWENYHSKLLLRSQQVSNSPEIIRRLGVIGMNTPVEVDIYAHANSTCVMGSRMLNGLGGSADFLRSAKYSIMHTPSTRPTKTDPTGLSCIVPMCTHIDQTEHDLDVVVTEQVSLSEHISARRRLTQISGIGRRSRPLATRKSESHHREVLTSRIQAYTAGLL